MIKEAVDYYHSLLEDGELANESYRVLHDGQDRARLIFAGRPLSPYLRPHFITAAEWARVTATCETIWSALQKVKDAAVADDTILSELGLTEVERELIKIDPGYYQVSPTSRLDSFLTEDAYSFVELNGESPAGIAYADSATEIFKTLPVMKRFMERYEVTGFDGRPKLLEVLLSCWDEFSGARPTASP